MDTDQGNTKDGEVVLYELVAHATHGQEQQAEEHTGEIVQSCQEGHEGKVQPLHQHLIGHHQGNRQENVAGDD